MLNNRIALITGPTSGIGRVTAIELAKKGIDLILLARNPEKAAALQQEIGEGVRAEVILCDLSQLDSVRKAASTVKDRFNKIDILINNAGLMLDHKSISAENIEMTFAVNHLAHFLLTTELVELLKKGDRARIIHVSSEAHRVARFQTDQLVKPDPYSGFRAYANSKLANILFSNELARRLKPYAITSNALHPGGVATNFGGEVSGIYKAAMWLARPFFITPEAGARTSIYLALSPEVEGVTGKYFSNQTIRKPIKEAQSTLLGQKLWELSEQLAAEPGQVLKCC